MDSTSSLMLPDPPWMKEKSMGTATKLDYTLTKLFFARFKNTHLPTFSLKKNLRCSLTVSLSKRTLC